MIGVWNEVWGLKYWISYLGLKGIYGYIIESISVFLPNKIISISPLTTQRLINKLKVNPKKIETIVVGVNYNQIRSILCAKEKNKIIFVGRLIKHKNVDILIKSLNYLDESIFLHILGNGPERENLSKLVKNLDLEKRVIFLNAEDDESVLKEIKSSGVLVLPSSREGFGMVVIEAQACGVPVITVNEKENASRNLIFNRENGLICKLDEREIAKSISFLLDNNLCSELKENCLRFSRNYDNDILVKKIEGVYLKNAT